MRIHTVLILAGGDGGRFYPLEQKMRFRFNGKPILQHIVESITDFAEHIVVVTNRVNEALIKSDLSAHVVEYVTQTRDEGGMADAILSAEKYLSSDVLITNGNDMIDFSIIPTLVEKTKKEASMVGIIAKHMKQYFPGGYVVFKDDKAVALMEKPQPEKIPSQYVRLVGDYFPEAALFINEIKKLSPSDDQNERAMTMLMSKKPATCIKYEGDWTTLKYSWHVLSMQDYFFKHHLSRSLDTSASIHKTASVEGEVYLGKNVKVGAYCRIVGPCYIGDNTIIGDHSLVRETTVEEKVLIGSGCEVARSYLAQGVTLHRNYVGDSVLSNNVTLGAGAVTANYRFDGLAIRTPVEQKLIETQRTKFGLIAGKAVKIGINASTYPGVKLSSGTIIAPGEVVQKDK